MLSPGRPCRPARPSQTSASATLPHSEALAHQVPVVNPTFSGHANSSRTTTSLRLLYPSGSLGLHNLNHITFQFIKGHSSQPSIEIARFSTQNQKLELHQ